MRKIGFAKYKKITKEILPKTYKVNEITCQRRMFCVMINQYLSAQAKIDIDNMHIYKNSLLQIFEDKIMSFFQFYRFKPEVAQKVKKIYAYESLVINQYFKQSKDLKMRYMSKNISFDHNFKMLYGYSHPAVDLIQLIFNGKDIEMMLDLNELFTRTVYSRVKKEINKTITLDMPYIHINQHGITTRLHPQWKRIDPQELNSRKEDINRGFENLDKEDIDQCYLVYPKTDKFKRHVTLKDESSKQIKMVPYSFTFINRKENRCKK